MNYSYNEPNLEMTLISEDLTERGFNRRDRRYKNIEENITINTKLLLFIETYIAAEGISPSNREIADHIGMSVNRTYMRMLNLRARGYITWSNRKGRTVQVLKPITQVY